jgi:hypothetical protein
MRHSIASVGLGVILSLTITALCSAFPLDDPAPVSASATPAHDVVTLKDGSVIHGEVIEMVGGVLQVKSALADDVIKVKWSEVSKLAVSHPIPFHLEEGTVLIGTVEEGEPGTMTVKAAPTGSAVTVPMDSVKQVNPVVQSPVIYSGSLNAGYSQSTGNSQLRNASVLADFVARSEQLRLTLLGRYVYGECPRYDQVGLLYHQTPLLVRVGLCRKRLPSESKTQNRDRQWTGVSISRAGRSDRHF